MDYAFNKIRKGNEDFIIIFRQGELMNPILMLDDNSIKKLNEEWKRKS